MSTLNLEHNATKKTNLIGHSYSGKQQLLVKPSLCEQVSAVFFNPIVGSPGSVHRVDYNLSIDDELIFCAASMHYRQFSQQGLKSEVQKLFPTERR